MMYLFNRHTVVLYLVISPLSNIIHSNSLSSNNQFGSSSCKNKCQLSTGFSPMAAFCSCDDSCLLVGDCCLDFAIECPNVYLASRVPVKNGSALTTLTVQELKNKSQVLDLNTSVVQFSTYCIDLPSFWPVQSYTSKNIYTSIIEDITSVFTLAGVNISRKCLPADRYNNIMTVVDCGEMPCKYNYGDENEVPVISSQTYNIYVSAQCAICNGESLTSLNPIYRKYQNCTHEAYTESEAVLHEHGIKAMKSILELSCMFYPFVDPLNNFVMRQTCVTGQLTDVEPVRENLQLDILCRHMQSYHYAHEKYYKNPFCLLQRPEECNFYQFDNKNVEVFRDNTMWKLGNRLIPAFTIMMDRGFYQISRGSLFCIAKENKDVSTCKTDVCSSDTLSYKGDCIKLYQVPGSDNKNVEFITVEYLCPRSMFTSFTKQATIVLSSLGNITIERCSETNASALFICGILHIVGSPLDLIRIYEAKIINLQAVAKNYICKFSIRAVVSQGCVNGKPYVSLNPALARVTKMFFIDYKINYKFVNLMNLSLLYPDYGENITLIVTTCLLEIQMCEKAILKKSEYSFLYNSSSVKITTGKILDIEEYAVLNNSEIIVCSDVLRVSKVMNFLTLVSNIISISSLFMTLTIYTIVPKMRTAPGKLVMQYTTVLLFSQLLFQFNDDFVNYPVVCRLVAALLHYNWLASFSCMTALAIKMAKTFVADYVPSHPSYAGYAISSMLAPLLVVVPCVIMDITDTGWFYYGDQMNCWISNAGIIDKFYAFSIPVLVLITVNIIVFAVCGTFLLITFFQVRSISPAIDNLSMMLVFLKLFSLMGLSWVFGFLPDITGNQLFWYPFIVFSCLQGLYIFGAFGCSSVARKEMRRKLLCCK